MFLCQRVPYPPDRGDRITTWNFIRHLSKSYDIYLFCLTSETKNLKSVVPLTRCCKSLDIYYKSSWRSAFDSLLYLLFTQKPLSIGYYYLEKIKSGIEKLISEKKIELIYAYSSNMFSHVYHLKHIKIIYHYADVDSEKWRKMATCGNFFMRLIYCLEYKRLRKWELLCQESGVCSVFATEQEKELFRSIGARGKLVTIKNGVDANYFRKGEDPQKENAIVFTGVMNYLPNVEAVLCFYREVYPLLKIAMPNVKFYVVGSNPSKKITKLAANDRNCFVTGYVDDVRVFMRKAKCFIAPIKVAQGMQNKILEALAMEVPVVAYANIAAPLGLGESQGVVVVDNPEEMTQAILRLLQSSELIAQLGKAGRKAMLEKYQWNKQLQILDNLVGSYIKKE
ncbi:MAG: TIGR03087 family PEP-CTERM/XrtA system glycosyltransferase [Candidatus Hodarchaeota archaeon]